MTDLRTTIIPKSDQLNADDLIGGRTLTIKVTKVSLAAGDQPVIIHYEGDNGHPYKPGKSMRRVLVHVWGPDGNAYIGRSMTLYCDEKVQFGGMAVGGIRISHMSHIEAPVTMALTATRASRKPFTVKPLAIKTETQGNGPAFITPQQRKEIVAEMGDHVKPAELLAYFSIKSTGEILTSQLPDVLEWVRSQMAPNHGAVEGETCSECGGPLSDDLRCHSEACPLGEPPE
jgi:hypothetical protein